MRQEATVQGMTVREAVEQFQYSTQRLSYSTQRSYVQKLGEFATWCEEQGYQLQDIKPTQVRIYTKYITQRANLRNGSGIKLSTAHYHIRAVKTFLKWCSREVSIEEFVTERTVGRIQLPRLDKEIIRVFSNEEIKRLLKGYVF